MGHHILQVLVVVVSPSEEVGVGVQCYSWLAWKAELVVSSVEEELFPPREEGQEPLDWWAGLGAVLKQYKTSIQVIMHVCYLKI